VWLAVASLLVCLAHPVPTSAGGEYEFVSLFSAPFPGANVDPPAINNQGVIVYSEGPTGSDRLWRDDGFGVELLDENLVRRIVIPTINDAGLVVALVENEGSAQVLRRYEPGQPPVDLVSSPRDFFAIIESPVSINESGDVAIWAAESIFYGSFYRLEYDEVTQDVEITDVRTLPGGGQIISGNSLEIDDEGTVYFEGRFSLMDEQIWAADESEVTPLVMPPMECADFFDAFVGNASGTLLARTLDCLYEVDDGAVTFINPPDPDAPFEDLGFGLSLSDNGRSLVTASEPSRGSVLYTGGNPIAGEVIGVGDALFGGTVDQLVLSRQAINDSGQMVFLAQIEFPNGVEEEHIVLADPISVPTSPTLTLAGTCPGPVTVQIDGATPSASVALVFGQEVGFSSVPMGACEGVLLNLEAPALLNVLSLDGAGSTTLDTNAPPGACGASLQAVDLGCCTVSGLGAFE